MEKNFLFCTERNRRLYEKKRSFLQKNGHFHEKNGALYAVTERQTDMGTEFRFADPILSV